MPAPAIPDAGASPVPRHVAVIMDGNGRWAEQRSLPRAAGHRAGARAVRAVIEQSVRHGVGALTLFAFSSENWQRPAEEVGVLMQLQAGAMGRNGETYLLEMGEPLRVADVARQMVRLSGLEPDRDIEIRYIGLRPGEKLFEELITVGEGIVPTSHEKLMVLRSDGKGAAPEVLARIGELEELVARCADSERIMRLAWELVPECRAGAGASARERQEA